MIFIYDTGDVIAFGIVLSLIIAFLVMMLAAAVQTGIRKIGEAFDRSFSFIEKDSFDVKNNTFTPAQSCCNDPGCHTSSAYRS